MVSLRTTLGRALVGTALLLPVAAVAVPTDAAASVSIAVGYEQLLKDADVVAVISSGEAKSVWEDGRIYTYTQVKVDRPVAGDMGAGATGWVRTMGGVVGNIGQRVDGEAILRDSSSLLFLRRFNSDGVYEVSARAQGQYPVIVDSKTKLRRIIRSTAVGMLVPPKVSRIAEEGPPFAGAAQPQSSGAQLTEAAKIVLAQDVIHDRPLDDAVREIATAWKRVHRAPAAK